MTGSAHRESSSKVGAMNNCPQQPLSSYPESPDASNDTSSLGDLSTAIFEVSNYAGVISLFFTVIEVGVEPPISCRFLADKQALNNGYHE